MSKQKVNRYFLHWYKNDYGRTVVVLVGDPKAAEREIRKYWIDKGVADSIVKGFNEITEDYPFGKLDDARSGRQGWNAPIAIVWFPVIPTVPTLAHELLHCVQSIAEDMRVRDDEFDAYTLDYLIDFFKSKLDADAKKPFENPMCGPVSGDKD